jgi:hypothetical protein
MKRSWTYYARYAVAALLMYLVFGWARERMENSKPDCPIGQKAIRDKSSDPWRCACNDPDLSLIEGVCQPPLKIDPMDPKTWST